MCIRRAILDAFWSRERATVASNKREGMMFISTSQRLGWDEPYPSRGPFQVEDACGMKVACSILLRSLSQGKNDRNIQYSTMRRMRSHMANFVHTIPGGMGPSFISSDNFCWIRFFLKFSSIFTLTTIDINSSSNLVRHRLHCGPLLKRRMNDCLL